MKRADVGAVCQPVNGIITGRIGVGKTTVCERVIELARAGGYAVRGVLTPAIIGPDGRKVGIAIIDLATGESRTLARTDQEGTGLQVGKYAFDPAALRWGCEALDQAIGVGCDLLLVDEVGPLELSRGGGFVRAVTALEAGILPHVLLVVRESLLDDIRQHGGPAPLLEFRVTEENRDCLPAEVVERLLGGA